MKDIVTPVPPGKLTISFHIFKYSIENMAEIYQISRTTFVLDLDLITCTNFPSIFLEETRAVIKKCLENAALVNYTQLSNEARLDGEFFVLI